MKRNWLFLLCLFLLFRVATCGGLVMAQPLHPPVGYEVSETKKGGAVPKAKSDGTFDVTWQAVIGGVAETYGSGWNGDTAAAQKNDIYDYLHLIDTNDDGDVDTIDSTLWATKLNVSETTATPTASKIPIANGSGKLDGWVSAATGSTAGLLTPSAPAEQGGTTPYVDHNRRVIKVVSTTPVNLTTAEMANGVVYIKTGASVVNLPAGASALDGVTCEFRLVNAVGASIDPNGSDVIDREGTDLAGGNKLTFSGVAGESFKLTWSNADSRWRTSDMNGVIVDGGA